MRRHMMDLSASMPELSRLLSKKHCPRLSRRRWSQLHRPPPCSCVSLSSIFTVLFSGRKSHRDRYSTNYLLPCCQYGHITKCKQTWNFIYIAGTNNLVPHIQMGKGLQKVRWESRWLFELDIWPSKTRYSYNISLNVDILETVWENMRLSTYILFQTSSFFWIKRYQEILLSTLRDIFRSWVTLPYPNSKTSCLNICVCKRESPRATEGKREKTKKSRKTREEGERKRESVYAGHSTYHHISCPCPSTILTTKWTLTIYTESRADFFSTTKVVMPPLN